MNFLTEDECPRFGSNGKDTKINRLGQLLKICLPQSSIPPTQIYGLCKLTWVVGAKWILPQGESLFFKSEIVDL